MDSLDHDRGNNPYGEAPVIALIASDEVAIPNDAGSASQSEVIHNRDKADASATIYHEMLHNTQESPIPTTTQIPEAEPTRVPTNTLLPLTEEPSEGGSKAAPVDREMADNSQEAHTSKPVEILTPAIIQSVTETGGSNATVDHEIADPSQPISATTQITEQELADSPRNGGLSAESGNTQSSDLADESALQHLNIDYSDDSDSALGDMTPQTSTVSINSSIYRFVEENGRTYHRYKEGKYMLPNDEDEKDRLDLQHQLWLITLYDELFLAPVKSLHNILDIGTGTGIWAIELANRYPSASVVGSDLSPIQPEYVPPNCQFEVDDAEDEWNYTQKFDLIHGRALVTCFKEPLTVITSAFNQLKPGGYLEFHDLVLPMRDIDGTLQGTNIDLWQTKTIASAGALGLSWKRSGNYARYMEEAGFVDIVEQHFQWPMNRWPKGDHMKSIGTYWQEDFTKGLEGLSMAVLTRGGGMTKDEVLELTRMAKIDIADKKIHAYVPIIVVYGRKPEA